MKKYRKLSICISVLNAIGIVCLFYCAALYLSHDTYVVNPDTMLPMMNWERGGMMLTMGVMPMLIANTLGFLYILKKGTSIIKRLLFFIPSILEVILVLHYWISSLLASISVSRCIAMPTLTSLRLFVVAAFAVCI